MDAIDIPFDKRNIHLPSGFSLIWPFRNKATGQGPYELVLDNNAFINANWFKELPEFIASRSIISPFHAVQEQWVSNEQFRANTEQRVDGLLQNFTKKGIKFSADYSSRIRNQLQKEDGAIRAEWMLSYLYVILLYRIVTAKKDDSLPSELLSSLKQENIPAFNGCIILCSLAEHLRKNQGLKMSGDTKPAFSYISSFVALHKKAKQEHCVNEHYLRNRAGDLSMWLSIPALTQNKYKKAGELVAVTRDTALSKLIFRCIPFVSTPDGRMAVSFDNSAFEPSHATAIEALIAQNIVVREFAKSPQEKLARLKQLKMHVTKGASNDVTRSVDLVWKEWLEPGFL